MKKKAPIMCWTKLPWASNWEYKFFIFLPPFGKERLNMHSKLQKVAHRRRETTAHFMILFIYTPKTIKINHKNYSMNRWWSFFLSRRWELLPFNHCLFSPDGNVVYSVKWRECLWRLRSSDWFQIALDLYNSRMAALGAMHCNLRRTMRMYVTRIDYRNVCSCILSTSFAVEELWISLNQCWKSNKKRDERKRIVDTYTRTKTHTHTYAEYTSRWKRTMTSRKKNKQEERKYKNAHTHIPNFLRSLHSKTSESQIAKRK